MAIPVVSDLSPEPPPELIKAIAHRAGDDADAAGALLNKLGIRPIVEGESRGPVRLPAWFLLELAAAMRLWIWEHHGIRLHLEAGLPPAAEAFRAVFRRLREPNNDATGMLAPLSASVLNLFIQHFAWSGLQDLGADLVLSEADDDELVDILANLIWSHRDTLHREQERNMP
jgi:hypothetical protein